MFDSLQVKLVSEPDLQGKYLVLLKFGEFLHRDKFDVEQSYQVEKYLARVVPKIKKIIDDSTTPKIVNSSGIDNLRTIIKQRLAEALEESIKNPIGIWQPAATSMIDVSPITPEWFWKDYIPAGAITVMDGDPGLGKSQTTIDIAARSTRGDLMPPLTSLAEVTAPGCVLMTNAEDDPARTIRPRLDAAEAVAERVFLLREMTGFDEEKIPVSLPLHLAPIEALIVEKNIALWIIDPWVAYLDSKLSMNNDADVRRCLGQVAAMAERTGVAVLLVRHLNKKSGSHAIYRGGGSIGITGAARSVLMVGQDPDDSDSRILAPVKSNPGPEPPSLRFSIEPFGDTSRVVWGDSCNVKASDLLKSDNSKQSVGSKQQQAETIISDVLINGPRGENEVLWACENAGNRAGFSGCPLFV